VAFDETTSVPDSEAVIVFTADRNLVRGYQFLRTVVDVSALSGRVFNANAARFRVVSEDARMILEPNE